MANYWFSFMEMVEILMINIQLLKIQDWNVFTDSLRLTIHWIQIYNNNNYGKWLVEFWTEISTLTKEIDEHMTKGLFAQSLTGNLYSCLPLDMWIEIMMKKSSKMKKGGKNILKNETILLSQARNANFINRIRTSMHKLADSKKPNKHVHKENQTGRLKAHEKGVQDLANCFAEFKCDPFDSTHTVVTTLHSAEVASIKLEEDFASIHTQDEKLVADFF